MGAVRLVVADDEFLVRQALGDLVDEEPGWELVGSCQDLDGLLAVVEQQRPDAVITDIRMPPTRNDEGIQAARVLRQRFPEIGVVVLSHYAEPGYVLDLLGDGTKGRGYLLKQHLADPGQLRDAVLAVVAGGSYVDAEVVRLWAASTQRQRVSPLQRLTPRERQVLAAMATGRNNTAIAADLVISEKAVQKHVNAVFTKLAVTAQPGRHGRVQAVLTYLQDMAGASVADTATAPR